MITFFRTVEAWVLPPGVFVLMWLVGLVSLRWHRRFAIGLSATGLLLFYLSSTPMVASLLIAPLESYPPLTDPDLDRSEAQAIVILSSGRHPGAPEFGGDTVSRWGLERIRYGAYLHRRTDLPILATGGSPSGRKPVLARLMADVLERDYGIEDVLTEEESRNTWENAAFSGRILQERGVVKVYVVTHAWHMPRSVDALEKVGFEVIPAPTAFAGAHLDPGGAAAWIPAVDALQYTQKALHEWIGRVWYRARHGA